MDKDFFILANSIKDVGSYPQHQKMSLDENGYDYCAPNSVHKLWTDNFLESRPNFNSIQLSNKVILTDKISSTPIPWQVLIVSKKLLSILMEYNLPPNRVYSVPVLHNREPVSDYFAVHILSPKSFLDEVNYEKSKFWITSGFENEKIKELKITSSNELKLEHSKLNSMRQRVRSEYFSMKSDFLRQMDLFAIPSPAFPVKYFISSNLKNAIEKENCTGVRFIERKNWQEPFIHKVLWKSLLKLPHS
ncbi:MAG: hypothetical protein AAF902_15795 [Chloroflexota bacterium]